MTEQEFGNDLIQGKLYFNIISNYTNVKWKSLSLSCSLKLIFFNERVHRGVYFKLNLNSLR